MVKLSRDVTCERHGILHVSEGVAAFIFAVVCLLSTTAAGGGVTQPSFSLDSAEHKLLKKTATDVADIADFPTSTPYSDVSLDGEIMHEMEGLQVLRASSAARPKQARLFMRRDTSAAAARSSQHEAAALMEIESLGEDGKDQDLSVEESSESSSNVPAIGYEFSRNIADSDGICDQMETEIDDDLLGSLWALERHQPLCHNDHVLRRWTLTRGGTVTRMKIKYTCCLGQYIGECKQNQTKWEEANKADTRVGKLEDHKVACFQNRIKGLTTELSLLRGWHFEVKDKTDASVTDPQKKVECGGAAKCSHIGYWCCAVRANGPCQDFNTTYTEDGGGHVGFLERHDLSCPIDHGMFSFHVKELASTPKKIKFFYTCCRLVAKPTFEELISTVDLARS